MDRIAFTKTKLPFGWLGNMSPYPVVWNELTYRTTEALFHCLRYDDESIRELIRAEKSPMGAKFVSKANQDKVVVQPCGEQDCENMLLCLRLKIEQHPDLAKALLDTGDAIITEDVTSRMSKPGNHLFWGAGLKDGEWVGSNILGELWMIVRAELAATSLR